MENELELFQEMWSYVGQTEVRHLSSLILKMYSSGSKCETQMIELSFPDNQFKDYSEDAITLTNEGINVNFAI